MKIFNSVQIKEWDAFSIKEQGILSIDLMERAAYACYSWLLNNNFTQKHIHLFCGKGNNGGDGLALARILIENNVAVSVYILELGKTGTHDFQENLQRLHRLTSEIHFIQAGFAAPPVNNNNDLVVDALFGTGLNKPIEELALELIEFLNNTTCPLVSIDIPSGLFTDKTTKGQTAISATYTLSFQHYKPAFLFPENNALIGQLHLLDIGLSSNYENNEPAPYELLEAGIVKGIIKPRNKFSNKGNFGHAALVAGSYGMMGAAVLAARSCLYSGAGKLTTHIPSCGYEIMQTVAPEAMCKVSGEKFIEDIENTDAYSAIGIGPGIGLQKSTGDLLKRIFTANPASLLLDADALNCIAADKKLLSLLPAGTIITPHPKEFERFFGKTSNDFERLELAIKKASELNIYIVLKGHHTAIITPPGKVYFNDTGNAGMAKAGMGDVLTGIITGLMAQHYTLPEAAILGVFLHGLAGDIAAEKFSQQAMQASDLIHCMGDAWKILCD
ncbi:MAG: NAD(P)H-hydrate dehydratase [Ferruginibacter sp.]